MRAFLGRLKETLANESAFINAVVGLGTIFYALYQVRAAIYSVAVAVATLAARPESEEIAAMLAVAVASRLLWPKVREPLRSFIAFAASMRDALLLLPGAMAQTGFARMQIATARMRQSRPPPVIRAKDYSYLTPEEALPGRAHAPLWTWPSPIDHATMVEAGSSTTTRTLERC